MARLGLNFGTSLGDLLPPKVMFIETDQLRIIRISRTGYTVGVEKHTYLLWEPFPANCGGLPMTFLVMSPGQFQGKYMQVHAYKERVVHTM